MLEALKAAGAPPEVIAAASSSADAEADDFEVWPENWLAVRIFVDLETSWTLVVPGFGAGPRRVGLPATEIHAAVSLCGVRKRDRPNLYRDLRTMERAAIEAMVNAR